MSTNAASTVHRRKPRTPAACEFCRRRKLGCDNAKPKCENCQVRDVECIYSNRVKQARPSNARIRRLEEENARLRESIRVQDSGSNSEQPVRPTSPFQHSPSALFPTPDDEDYATETIPISGKSQPPTHETPPSTDSSRQHPCPDASEDSPFHGPSSSMFELARVKSTTARDLGVSDAHAKDKLLAETTRQRQLEVINFGARKLDFDGQDPNLGIDLLAIYWNRQHYAGSIVYRPVFMRDMACNGPYFSKLLLNAMLFAGSKYTDRIQVRSQPNKIDSTGRPFRHRFEEILYESGSQILLRSKVTTIQALLIVADALFSWCDERSLSWHYMGIAINMIVDLGIHVEGATQGPSINHSIEDSEVYRRVFWSAFALDKVQSIYQGRPARLREADNRVPIQFLDKYEELEEFNTLTYSETPRRLGCPTYSVSTFEQLCKLSIIMDRVLCSLYAEKTLSRNAEDLLRTSNILHGELKNWRAEMPAHLLVQLDDPCASTILPHTLSLLAMYNSLIILLHRPFVSDSHLQSTSAAHDAFSHCVSAAREIQRILQLYKQHFCLKTVPYFVSYATYVSGTIHVRLAAQKSANSDAHKRLRDCLEALAEHQTKCHGPRRTMKILIGLMDRLKVNIGDINFSIIDQLNCQADGVRRTSGDLAPSHETTRRSPQTDQFLHNDYQTSSDSTLADFNIDEIMKSFDFTETSQPIQGISQDSVQYSPGPGLQLDTRSSGLGMANTVSDSLAGTSSILQNPDPLIFPDFLFGLDFDMS